MSLGARVSLLLVPLVTALLLVPFVTALNTPAAHARQSGDFAGLVDVGGGRKMYLECRGMGSRPRASHDQRTQSTYLFGAVCPQRGAGAALVLPACNTEAMQLHLSEIATKVTPGAHAILILDKAGWHGAKDLELPGNISLLPLPPRAPELNSQENIWQFMRQNWLSNRVFKSFDDIVDHCCYAWNTLIDQPWKIMSIAHRDWAIVGQSL
jgi:hypothetical protein